MNTVPTHKTIKVGQITVIVNLSLPPNENIAVRLLVAISRINYILHERALG